MTPHKKQSNPPFLVVVSAAAALLVSLAACSEKPKTSIKTTETTKVQGAVETYELTGSKESKLQAETAFADLDREIKELELRVESTTGEQRSEALGKMVQLKTREAEIRSDYNEAKFNVLIQDIKNSVR